MFRLLARIAYTIIVLIQGIIAIRFVARLFNLNSSNELVKWVIETSEIFVSPFYGVLDQSTLVVNGFTLDLNALVAGFFFLIAGFICIEIVKAFSAN